MGAYAHNNQTKKYCHNRNVYLLNVEEPCEFQCIECKRIVHRRQSETKEIINTQKL